MKTLLFLTLLTFKLFAGNVSFILPHQLDNALFYLSKELNKAQSSVTIVSTKIDIYELKKVFLSLVDKKIPVRIISYSKNGSGVKWVQYTNVSLFIVDTSRMIPLSFSLISIDNSLTCKLSTTLETSAMRNLFSLLECSHTKYAHRNGQKIITTLLRYASPYLEEVL